MLRNISSVETRLFGATKQLDAGCNPALRSALTVIVAGCCRLLQVVYSKRRLKDMLQFVRSQDTAAGCT